MKDIIEEYDKSDKEEYQLVNAILKIVFNKEKCNLPKAYQIISDLKKEISLLESGLFSVGKDIKSVCGVKNV